MNRRQALQQVSLLLGGTMIGAQAFLDSACTRSNTHKILNSDQIFLLNEIGETIFPETDTPGARAADVGSFMDVIVADCYTPEDQKVFLNGLEKLQDAAKKSFGKDFLKLSPQQREELLTAIDQEHIQYTKNKGQNDPAHYFRMMKELTLAGYFTSEIGATQFNKYNPAPGRYDGCTTEKPWH